MMPIKSKWLHFFISNVCMYACIIHMIHAECDVNKMFFLYLFHMFPLTQLDLCCRTVLGLDYGFLHYTFVETVVTA